MAIAAGFAGPGVAAEDITGVWLTAQNEGAIEIRPCGSDRCGYIVWMGDPKSEGKTDQHNPDPNLRSRKLCGMQIITGLKQQSDGTWADGRVYDPQTGNSYDMKIQRDTSETLKATGYMGLQLLGRTMEWRRAPKRLGGCDAKAKR